MYRWETDKNTYLRLKECLNELHPEIKIELIACDENLEKLAFTQSAPCVVNLYLTKEQRRILLDELEMIEMDSIDFRDIKSNERYEKYGWIWDIIFNLKEIEKPARKRASQINTVLLQSNVEIYRLRRLDCQYYENITYRTYIISLKKESNITLEEQVRRIYISLQNVLRKNEYLNTDNHCFSVCGENYKIVYCIEAYKKNADKFGYAENGEIKTDFLHRMGCEVAVKWLKNQSQVINGYVDLNSQLSPADQFVNKVMELKKN